MNTEEIKKFSDEELAKHEWPPLGQIVGPDAILIREEWKRRGRLEQAKINRVSVLMGSFLTIVGTILGALLTWLLR